MNLDYTRLIKRLEPEPDGESAVRHRSGLVDAVNADGTVDLDLSGVVIPSVSVLDGAFISVGDTVQVAAWSGDLLVLGRARQTPSGAWQDWSPTYNNITIGNGTVVARYVLMGATAIVRWFLVLGSTSSIGNNPEIQLPVAVASGYPAFPSLWAAYLRDNSPIIIYPATVRLTSVSAVVVNYNDSSGAAVTRGIINSTTPFTWATSDEMGFVMVYEW